MIIATDFDGTLCSEKYPQIGEPKWEIIDFIKTRKDLGDKIILWTCREGLVLEEAIKFSKKWGLSFDYINENCPEKVSMYNNNSRKIGADLYIDDRSLNPIYEISRLRFIEDDLQVKITSKGEE